MPQLQPLCRPAMHAARPAPATGRTRALLIATGSTLAVTPGSSSKLTGALFWNASITWNSGCRDSERAGLSTSTSRSNGSPGGCRPAGLVVRTRAISSRKLGLPDGSVRSTSVLTKNPIRSSSRAVGAAAPSGADQDVAAGAQPREQGRQRRLQHHERLARPSRASARGQRAAPPTAPAARCRRDLLDTEGRARSLGRSS